MSRAENQHQQPTMNETAKYFNSTFKNLKYHIQTGKFTCRLDEFSQIE